MMQETNCWEGSSGSCRCEVGFQEKENRFFLRLNQMMLKYLVESSPTSAFLVSGTFETLLETSG